MLPGKEIIATQFSDAALTPSSDTCYEARHNRLVPGQGTINMEAIIQTLDASGYRALFGVELLNDELDKLPPEEAAQKAGDATRAVMSNAREGILTSHEAPTIIKIKRLPI